MSNFPVDLTNPYSVIDSLNIAAPIDSFTFSLNTPQSVELSLTNFTDPIQYQLEGGGEILDRGTLTPPDPAPIMFEGLQAGDYTLGLLGAGEDTNYTLNLDPLTGMGFESGFFRVGETGEVTFDFLLDGGIWEGEVAIVSLTGMDQYQPGTPEFIQEAARRALTGSTEGHIVIRDQVDGGRFSVELPWEPNFNLGIHQDPLTVRMVPGDTFFVMLVPNGTVEEVYENPNITGEKQPLFSLATANSDDFFYFGQVVDLTGDGHSFSFEDVNKDHPWFDQDYNDIVIQIEGAIGYAPLFADLVDPQRDWRPFLPQLIDFIENKIIPITPNLPPNILELNIEPGDGSATITGTVEDGNGFSDLSKIDLWLQHPDGSWENISDITGFTDNANNIGGFTHELTGLVPGDYRLRGIAIDQGGAFSVPFEQEFSLDIFNTPPESLGFTLEDVYSFGDSIYLENTQVFDADGFEDLDRVELSIRAVGSSEWVELDKINDLVPGEGAGWGTFDGLLNLGNFELESGDYELRAVAFDLEGAISNEVIHTFGMNTAPEFLEFHPLPVYTTGEDLHIENAKVSDPDGIEDIVRIDFWLQPLCHSDLENLIDIPDVTEIGEDGRFDYTFDLSQLEPGTYQLMGTAVDSDGATLSSFAQFTVISDPGTDGLSDDIRLAMADAANLDRYDPAELAQTSQWIVWLEPGTSANNIASQLGATNLGETGFIPNTYAFEFPLSMDQYEIGRNLQCWEGVEFAHPDVPINLFIPDQTDLDKDFYPDDDPDNTVIQPDQRIIEARTRYGVTGEGIVIGLMDDGFQGEHPNLGLAYRPDLSFDFNSNDADPSPFSTNLFWQRDFSDPVVSEEGITFVIPSTLTGLITDTNVALSLPPNLQEELQQQGLQPYLYKADFVKHPGTSKSGSSTSYNWGLWSSYYGWRYFPGVDDLDEQKWVRLNFQNQESQSFETFDGLGAGGFWLLKFEDVNDFHKKDNLETLEQLSQQLASQIQWNLILDTVNPHGTASGGSITTPLDAMDEVQDGTTTGGNITTPLETVARVGEGTTTGGITTPLETRVGDGTTTGDSITTEDVEGEGRIAPDVQLAALRLIGDVDPLQRPTSLTFANALYDQYRNGEIDLFNGSFIPEYFRRYPLALAALERGREEGRNQFGNSYIFAAGNDGHYGSDTNYNFIANSRHTITVGSVNHEGIHNEYSNPGASLFITAPSDDSAGEYGVYTADVIGDPGYQRGNFNPKFGGTSAATAYVTGVMALILQANPDLTARDLQHILADTALQTDGDNPSWTQNGAGRWFSRDYGFGVVDPVAAVAAARDWVPVAEEISITSGLENVIEGVPDQSVITATTNIEENIQIETVEVILDLEHRNWTDLTIELVSPSGTVSQLAQAFPEESHEELLKITDGVSPRGFDPTSEEWVSTSAWMLTSNQFWGEESLGDWTLRVLDEYGNEITGEWKSWKLNLYGTEAPPPANVTLTVTDSTAQEDGSAAQFVVTREVATDAALRVNYTLSGSAVNGVDYQELTGTVTIAPGDTSATIGVIPIFDYENEGIEDVAISLVAGERYNIGVENGATASLENSTATARYGPFVYVNPANGHQYILSQFDSWLGAQEQAEALGGNLVTVNDADEQQWLLDTFGTTIPFWIGLTDSDIYNTEEGNFTWISGEPIAYTNWHPNEPNNDGQNGGQNFVKFNYDLANFGLQGVWDDTDLTNAPDIPYGIIEINPNSLSQPIVNLMVTDSEAGEDGNAGQILVTRVGNLNQDLTVNYTVGGSATNGSDYETLSGTVIIPAGELMVSVPVLPLNDATVEVLESVEIELVDNADYSIGTHGVAQVSIIESSPSVNPVFINPANGHRYVLTAEDTWLGAQEQAQKLGGNLVTINDADEQSWLISSFGNISAWTGLNDSPIYGNTEGNFQWLNGEPLTYTNWDINQPGNYFDKNPIEGEDFGVITPGSLGNLWHDFSNLDITVGIVELS